jgi:hypothetical protein
MLDQLRKFKLGTRGTDAADTWGRAMQPIVAATLPNEQAMRDVIAHVKTLAP